MAPNYLFKISITGNISGGKLVRVLYDADQQVDGYAMPAEVVDVFGGTVLSAGVGKRTYKFTALVQYTAATSGYATYQNVKEWFSIETAPAGVSPISATTSVFTPIRMATTPSSPDRELRAR